MTTRQRNALILLALAAAAGLGAWRAGAPGGGGPVPSVDDAVPKDSFLVASVDLQVLRGSPLGPPLEELARSQLPALARLSAACGWDVLSHLREVVMAVPEEGDSGEFGVAARVDASPRELSACADHLTESGDGGAPKGGSLAPGVEYIFLDGTGTPGDGGGPEADPKETPAPTTPRLAYRPRGSLLLLANPPWLAKMMAAADRRGPTVAADANHVALRASVSRGDGPGGKRALVATALLPRSLRDRLRSEMKDEANPAMEGVLGVHGVALAVTPGVAGGQGSLVAELRCDDAPSCDETKKLLERKRLGWSQNLGLRLVGLGPLIDSFAAETKTAQAQAQGGGPGSALGAVPTVTVTARWPADDGRRLVERLAALRASGNAGTGRVHVDPGDPAPPPPPRNPDEVLGVPPTPSAAKKGP